MPVEQQQNRTPQAQQEHDDSSSEEEFNVDDYLNTTTSTATTVPTRVSFMGVVGDSPSSSSAAAAEHNKDAEELRREIHQVQIALSQAQIDLSHEKILRRKAERNLVKLAKEFQKRKSEEFTMQQDMSELRAANASLEVKLGAVRQELQERIQTKEESLRNHQEELLEMQRRYREACRGHEARVAELNRTHSAEVEDLRRQHGEAIQDSDRLRSKLVTLEVKEAERIAERALSANMDDMNGISRSEYNRRSRGKEDVRWKRVVLAAVVVLFAAFYQITGLSMDAICSPVMAGTRLNKEGTWAAPWWAPKNFKERAFFQVCGDRPRTGVAFTFDSSGSNRISIKEIGDTPEILLDRKVSSAIVKVDRIDLMLERKGKVESVKLPWAL